MSGVTPILDTLLHQVLGKRVDIPLVRNTHEPVRPPDAGGLVQAVRSDSRLDPRAPLRELPGADGRVRPGAAPARAGPAESGSVRTHFSAAARTIADLLVRYPAPPSAIRPPAPLLAPGDGVERLARQLRASVDRSGLFYEAHLGDWFRGKLSVEQLAREPQMTLTRVQSPTTGIVGGAQDAPPPAAGPEGAGGNAGQPGPAVRVPVDDAASETLQGLLRHQLEMLANPVLRWDGEVWPGVAMALVVQAPPQAQRREDPGEKGEESEREQEREESSWHSRLTLRLDGLGEILVRLQMRGEHLALSLGTPSGDVAECLDGSRDRLRERLRAHGFREVLLNVETTQ
ncbi:flagellar hook-length control protein FliK [Microbulbifer sp.]|uniref:flagellar hook-length control protein FliK n=1 Tax=Microbulbifer sp. TaxID=1908541 RepID=UPI003F30C5AA